MASLHSFACSACLSTLGTRTFAANSLGECSGCSSSLSLSRSRATFCTATLGTWPTNINSNTTTRRPSPLGSMNLAFGNRTSMERMQTKRINLTYNDSVCRNRGTHNRDITIACTGVVGRAEFEIHIAGGNPVILNAIPVKRCSGGQPLFVATSQACGQQCPGITANQLVCHLLFCGNSRHDIGLRRRCISLASFQSTRGIPWYGVYQQCPVRNQ